MRSESTPFEGGPMDGRSLPILLGPTGHPPKWYEIPVPNPDGAAPTVLLYERVPAGQTKRLGLRKGWKYTYRPDTTRPRARWPWR
ncbi:MULTISPECIES: hypothetical protein [unclassified Streptomyces]|uniref:hypothetical protein n=1 Tax=unclassified Streptomyces TaxID=2593676 RepID=UPI00109EA9E0|nr:hypothetical protein [Streptomyces sp. A1136]THA52466.1 hypothetical protein E6R62_21235 [Streptomyces sp. A1136]